MKNLEPLKRYQKIIEDFSLFLESLKEELPKVIWANPLKISPYMLPSLMEEEGFTLKPISWYKGAFYLEGEKEPSYSWGYHAGLFHIQEEVSLLPVWVLSPKKGEKILDLCAAPGGKTAQMAISLNNQGSIIANDIHWQRIRALSSTLERLGILNVSITQIDGCNYPPLVEYWDKVLVDAPCSSEGTIRKNPKKIPPIGREISLRYTNKQVALLKKAIQLVRVGGEVLYSTCTFSPEENEKVLHEVLKFYGSSIKILPISLPLKSSPGILSWEGEKFFPQVENARRIYPHQNNTGGFFLALIKKLDSTSSKKIPVEEKSPSLISWEKVYEGVIKRYGIPEEIFSLYIPFQETSHGLYFLVKDHKIPKSLSIKRSGMIFLRTRSKTTKLSTEGAKFLGKYAQKNFLELKKEELYLYLQRKPISISRLRGDPLSKGFILVRYQGYPLGVALYKNQEIESLYPKGMYP